MESYVENIHAYPDDDDPLSLWIQNQEMYPSMASCAFDVLTIPGSSAPVERVFFNRRACYYGETKPANRPKSQARSNHSKEQTISLYLTIIRHDCTLYV